MTDNRFDDYANFLSGLAGPPDKSSYTFFERQPMLQRAEIEALYEQDAIAARIVDRVVDDSFRTRWNITGTDIPVENAELESVLEDLKVNQCLAQAWREAREYGGALVILSVADGKSMDQPLDLSEARYISALNVVPSPLLLPDGWGNNSIFPFSNPEYYNFLLDVPPVSGAGPRERKVHRIHKTRVIRFDSFQLSPYRMINYNGWAPSVLQRVYRELTQLGEAVGYGRAILHDISVEVMKFEGLREQLCGGPNAREGITQMVEQMRMMKDNLHILALDANDDIEERRRTVTGISELLEQFISALVRATDMPRTVLLGEQPGGQNASADSEIRSWYDHVDAVRKKTVNPAINRILEIYYSCQRNLGLDAPDKWVIEWEPLWAPSQEELLAMAKTESETLVSYMTSGVLTREEIRAKLLSQGYFDAIEVEKATSTTVGPAQVGVWTGVTALLQAVYPTGIPPQIVAWALSTLDPERYTLEEASAKLAPPTPAAPASTVQALPAGAMDPNNSDAPVLEEPEAAPSTAPLPNDLCSTKEAASRCGIPTVALNNLCRKGELPYWGFGNHKQVSMAQVLQLGKSHEESTE